MSNITSLDQLANAEVASFDIIPEGWYNAVITKAALRQSKAGNEYLNLELSLHEEGYEARKTWGMVHFTEASFNMPGNAANLVQSLPDGAMPLDLGSEGLVVAVGQAATGQPVRIKVEIEHSMYNVPEGGEPVQRNQVGEFGKADAEFADTIEAEAAGLDSDLPF